MVADAFAVPSDLLPYADFLRSHGRERELARGKVKDVDLPASAGFTLLVGRRGEGTDPHAHHLVGTGAKRLRPVPSLLLLAYGR